MALSLDTLSPPDAVAALQRPEPAMPPEKHLDMPTQSLRRWSRARSGVLRPRPYARPGSHGSSSSAAGCADGYGAYEMYQVVSVSRTTILQWLLLALFTINFSWIALAFTSAVLGFLALLRRPPPPAALPAALESRTAIVMPVYNEQTARTFAALEAIRESVDATGLGGAFDYFILSDSTSPTPGSRRSARSSRCGSGSDPNARLYLPAPAEEPSPQGRQHRRFRPPLGRALRAHARARRRQPDDGRVHRAARGRDGGGSGRGHHPDAAADHQPQHLLRPPPAIRRPGLRPGHRDRPFGLDGPGRQLLGPQRDHPHEGLRGPCRPARSQGQAAARRPYPEPRLRRGGAHPAGRLDGLHAAGPRRAPTRRARRR